MATYRNSCTCTCWRIVYFGDFQLSLLRKSQYLFIAKDGHSPKHTKEYSFTDPYSHMHGTCKPTVPQQITQCPAHLIKQEFPPLLSPEVHLLHSHQSLARGLSGSVHRPCRSLTNLGEIGQVVSRICGIYKQLHRRSKLFIGHLSSLSSVRTSAAAAHAGRIAAARGLSCCAEFWS